MKTSQFDRRFMANAAAQARVPFAETKGSQNIAA
jgi:hypothetical protein